MQTAKTGHFIEACGIDYKPLENPQLLRDNPVLLKRLSGKERKMGGAQRGAQSLQFINPR